MFKPSQGEDDEQLYNFNTELGPAGAPPGTSSYGGSKIGFGKPPATAAARGAMASSMGRGPPGTAAARGFPPGTAARMGTAAQGGGSDARPMTSVSGAGYKGDKDSRSKSFDPLNIGKGPAPPLAEKSDNSHEDKAKEMEKNVHRLIEASAEAIAAKDFTRGLEKAKEAGKAERALCKVRKKNNSVSTAPAGRLPCNAPPFYPPLPPHTHVPGHHPHGVSSARAKGWWSRSTWTSRKRLAFVPPYLSPSLTPHLTAFLTPYLTPNPLDYLTSLHINARPGTRFASTWPTRTTTTRCTKRPSTRTNSSSRTSSTRRCAVGLSGNAVSSAVGPHIQAHQPLCDCLPQVPWPAWTPSPSYIQAHQPSCAHIPAGGRAI